MAKASLIIALALRDLLHLGVAGGDLVQGTEEQITPLKEDGSVDTHKEAVTAARARMARSVKLPAPIDPEAQAALEQAHARVHHLEAVLQATPEAERAPLAEQLDAARAALAKLTA